MKITLIDWIIFAVLTGGLLALGYLTKYGYLRTLITLMKEPGIPITIVMKPFSWSVVLRYMVGLIAENLFDTDGSDTSGVQFQRQVGHAKIRGLFLHNDLFRMLL